MSSNYKKPDLIVVSVSIYRGGGVTVLIKHPNINEMHDGVVWVNNNRYENMRDLRYVSFLLREGYEVYHIDRIDEFTKWWYWRLKGE